MFFSEYIVTASIFKYFCHNCMYQYVITALLGYCTKLGPRNTNEDRLVCLPDIYEKLLVNGDFDFSYTLDRKHKVNVG